MADPDGKVLDFTRVRVNFAINVSNGLVADFMFCAKFLEAPKNSMRISEITLNFISLA